MRKPYQFGLGAILCSLLFLSACHDPARPGTKQGKPIDTALLCACKPTHITKDDWRIEFKNGDLPAGEPEQTSVAAMLSWPEGPEPGPRTPRSGRELKLYRIPKAYLQTVFFRKSDCDLHLEISETSDENAPRMIIETPGAAEYCPARTQIYTELQRRGIAVTDLNQELASPLPVQIVGVPFRDQAHPIWFARGSDRVLTLWELHPAIVQVLP